VKVTFPVTFARPFLASSAFARPVALTDNLTTPTPCELPVGLTMPLPVSVRAPGPETWARTVAVPFPLSRLTLVNLIVALWTGAATRSAWVFVASAEPLQEAVWPVKTTVEQPSLSLSVSVTR
jgi:hypothetical protein